MKNLFFLLLVFGFSFSSCRKDDEVIQRIDQVINLYIDSAGVDMLNTNIPGGYSNIQMNDVNGLRDSAPVSFTLKKDADTINYIEYTAGARRIGVDTLSFPKIYESEIALILNKKVNDSTSNVINDTMTVHYSLTPELFQVSKVWYNGVLQFSKNEGVINTVKVTK